MTSHLGRISLILSLLTAVALACSPAFAVEVQDAAPGFDLEDLDGETYLLNNQDVYLLFFFSPDNPFSVTQAPKLEADIWSEYSWHNFHVLGVNLGPQSREAIEAFRDATKVTFPLIVDGAAAGAAYGAMMNQYVVIDRDGIVVYVSHGTGADAYHESELKAAVSGALQQVAPPKEATWGRIKTLFEREGARSPL